MYIHSRSLFKLVLYPHLIAKPNCHMGRTSRASGESWPWASVVPARTARTDTPNWKIRATLQHGSWMLKKPMTSRYHSRYLHISKMWVWKPCLLQLQVMTCFLEYPCSIQSLGFLERCILLKCLWQVCSKEKKQQPFDSKIFWREF